MPLPPKLSSPAANYPAIQLDKDRLDQAFKGILALGSPRIETNGNNSQLRGSSDSI